MDAAQELIGRQEELSLLTGFLADLAAGPRALLVEGEAAIGKTALWQAGLAQARARGQRTLACRPAGSEVKLSFAALGDLLAGGLQEALPALPAPQRRGLEAALLLADPEAEPPDQRAIGLGLLNVLRTLSLAGPLLVAIDDAQWLDQPSAAVLAFALRRLAAEPVGVLATVRRAASPHPTNPCRCLRACVRWCAPGSPACRRRPASRCWPLPRAPGRRSPCDGRRREGRAR